MFPVLRIVSISLLKRRLITTRNIVLLRVLSCIVIVHSRGKSGDRLFLNRNIIGVLVVGFHWNILNPFLVFLHWNILRVVSDFNEVGVRLFDGNHLNFFLRQEIRIGLLHRNVFLPLLSSLHLLLPWNRRLSILHGLLVLGNALRGVDRVRQSVQGWNHFCILHSGIHLHHMHLRLHLDHMSLLMHHWRNRSRRLASWR